jgi:transposase InsO family protein
MPWKESLVPDQRMRFVLACLDDEESMAALCRRFGVSRPTGYKWLRRYREGGPELLSDRSSAPQAHPNQVRPEIEKRILSMRAAHPTWGSRKIVAALARQSQRDREDLDWPAASTVGQMLKRAGLAFPRRHRRDRASATPGLCGTGAAQTPNHRWCADFKGWFRTGDGSRCDPLTITDAHSRFLLRCQAAQVAHSVVRGLFEATFREFGMPQAIRTDNGEPFASVGLKGLSRLAVWWMRLGIAHERIEPGRPQQNGSHERMHGTLKRQTANPPAHSLRAQQARFDRFREEYNKQRPHEGLPDMATPGSIYRPSAQPYPDRLPEMAYPPGQQLRRVDDTGKFTFNGKKVRLCKPLSDQTIGLEPLREESAELDADRFWIVRFGSVDLGVLDGKECYLLSERARRHLVP